MKRSKWVDVSTAVLLLYFVHSFVSTYIQFLSLRNTLAFYTENREFWVWTLIVTEFITALLLFVPKTRLYGLTLSLLFAIFVITLIFITPHYPHHFGGILNVRSRRFKLVVLFLVGLISLSAIISKLLHKRTVLQANSHTVAAHHLLFDSH
jgi:signal transduction histidine kinase